MPEKEAKSNAAAKDTGLIKREVAAPTNIGGRNVDEGDTVEVTEWQAENLEAAGFIKPKE